MEETYRRLKGSLLQFIAFSVMLALAIPLTVISVREADWGWALFFGGSSAGCIFVVARVLFVRIVAEPQGVRLVNWFGSRRLAWSEVTSIDPPAPYGRLINGILLTTSDGKVHVATAFSPGPLDAESVTSGVVAELRGLHAQYRTPPPPAGA
ncbi:MAG: PH domain-containing protein [Candidatus Nanopelagicales bacterium]|jgi:hypothetical protein|nr:PH domain-containing protein [Candidatus Nanopelagicales bacterium]